MVCLRLKTLKRDRNSLPLDSALCAYRVTEANATCSDRITHTLGTPSRYVLHIHPPAGIKTVVHTDETSMKPNTDGQVENMRCTSPVETIITKERPHNGSDSRVSRESTTRVESIRSTDRVTSSYEHLQSYSCPSLTPPRPSFSSYRPGKHLVTSISPANEGTCLPSTETPCYSSSSQPTVNYCIEEEETGRNVVRRREDDLTSSKCKVENEEDSTPIVSIIPRDKRKWNGPRLPQHPPLLRDVDPNEFSCMLHTLWQLEEYINRRTPCELIQFPSSTMNDHGCFVTQAYQRYSSSSSVPRQTREETSFFTSSSFLQQCIATCRDAIDSGTFAEDYPKYCLGNLIQPPLFPGGVSYTQGAALRERATGKIIAWVYTNARDDITNFKATVVALRSQRSKHPDHFTTAMETFSKIAQFDDFFHVNLLVTHPSYRGKGYAKVLLYFSLVYWGLRGLFKSYLNMALEKAWNEETGKMECRCSPSSYNLYRSFQYVEVFPKFTNSGTFRWTQAEADMGRVMINLDTRQTMVHLSKLYNFTVI